MIVQNRHYREDNFIVGANALKAMTASLKGIDGLSRGLRGLGAFDFSAISDCSMLTSFQRAQAPQCGGGSGGSGGPAVYQAPQQLAIEKCDVFDTACVNRNLVTQQGQIGLNNEANRAVFVQNCNDAWLANDSRYAALNLPRPPNDCEGKTYGQVFSSSGPASFVNIVAATDLIPSVKSSNTQVTAYQGQQSQSTQAATQDVGKQTAAQTSAGGGNTVTGSGPIDLSNITEKVKELGSGAVSVMGVEIPYLVIAAGVAGLFLLGGRN